MEFVCPVCETVGDLPQEDLEQPLTKTICPKCSAILLINPDSGKVVTHKSSLKDSPVLGKSSLQHYDKVPSVLSMRPQEEESWDWLALGVAVLVLITLISAGIYFAINLDIF